MESIILQVVALDPEQVLSEIGIEAGDCIVELIEYPLFVLQFNFDIGPQWTIRTVFTSMFSRQMEPQSVVIDRCIHHHWSIDILTNYRCQFGRYSCDQSKRCT